MIKADVISLLERVRAVYPREFMDISANQLDYKIEIWHEILKPFPYEAAYRAFVQLAGEDVKGFAPVVGAIAARAAKLCPRSAQYREKMIDGTLYAVAVSNDECTQL